MLILVLEKIIRRKTYRGAFMQAYRMALSLSKPTAYRMALSLSKLTASPMRPIA